MFIDILTDTVVAKQETPKNRFVKIDGSMGATTTPFGVTRYGGETNENIDVMAVGIAQVEVATGVTVVVGDFVASDIDGKAVVDNTNGKFLAKTGGTKLIEVLLR